MNRRRLLVAASALLSAPLLHAQAQRMRRLGILVPAPGYPDRYEALKAGLAALGWIEGRNLAIEWRHAESKYERLESLAGELVQAGAEVILTNSTVAVIAARKATQTVPIVSAAFSDPVQSGLIASLQRPGGNVTGMSIIFDAMSAKMLELLRTLLPKAARVGVLRNPRGSQATYQDIAAQAQKSGLTLISLPASTVPELQSAFELARRERVEAVLAIVEPFMVGNRAIIGKSALASRMPVIAQSAEFVEAGCLASYGPDFRASFRRAASYVHRILNGAAPGELPVEQTTALELSLNRRTAAAIGVALPQDILLRADRVIE